MSIKRDEGFFECLSHYQKYYCGCRSILSGNILIYGADKLRL